MLFSTRVRACIDRAIWIGNAPPHCSTAIGARARRTLSVWRLWRPGFSSLPIILAVCALTGLVGINYIVICRHFPDGGGVYSAAREQSRLLAVVGALLLVADLTVTAALSGWSALSYITSGAEQIDLDQICSRAHRAHDDWRVVDHGPDQLFRAEAFRQFRCGAGVADCADSRVS